MKVSINGVDVEMACFNCFHWMGNREAPTTPGICIAKPPTAFMVFVQEGDIVTAEAQLFLTRGIEDVERLRREASPLTVLEDIPEWESVMGMTESVVALNGTPAQRRAQIISRLRERGATTVEMVRADLDPRVRDRLQEVLLQAASDPQAQGALHRFFGTSGFHRVDAHAQQRLDELKQGLTRVRMEVE